MPGSKPLASPRQKRADRLRDHSSPCRRGPMATSPYQRSDEVGSTMPGPSTSRLPTTTGKDRGHHSGGLLSPVMTRKLVPVGIPAITHDTQISRTSGQQVPSHPASGAPSAVPLNTNVQGTATVLIAHTGSRRSAFPMRASCKGVKDAAGGLVRCCSPMRYRNSAPCDIGSSSDMPTDMAVVLNST